MSADMPQTVPTSGVRLTCHNYAANYGNTGFFAGNGAGPIGCRNYAFGGAPFTMKGNLTIRESYAFRDILDEPSNTLMFGEVIQEKALTPIGIYAG